MAVMSISKLKEGLSFHSLWVPYFLISLDCFFLVIQFGGERVSLEIFMPLENKELLSFSVFLNKNSNSENLFKHRGEEITTVEKGGIRGLCWLQSTDHNMQPAQNQTTEERQHKKKTYWLLALARASVTSYAEKHVQERTLILHRIPLKKKKKSLIVLEMKRNLRPPFISPNSKLKKNCLPQWGNGNKFFLQTALVPC